MIPSVFKKNKDQLRIQVTYLPSLGDSSDAVLTFTSCIHLLFVFPFLSNLRPQQQTRVQLPVQSPGFELHTSVSGLLVSTLWTCQLLYVKSSCIKQTFVKAFILSVYTLSNFNIESSCKGNFKKMFIQLNL